MSCSQNYGLLWGTDDTTAPNIYTGVPIWDPKGPTHMRAESRIVRRGPTVSEASLAIRGEVRNLGYGSLSKSFVENPL